MERWKEVQMNKKMVDRVVAVLEQFPDINRFTIKESPSNGIGTTTNMEFECVQNGVRGSFCVEIDGVENW